MNECKPYFYASVVGIVKELHGETLIKPLKIMKKPGGTSRGNLLEKFMKI